MSTLAAFGMLGLAHEDGDLATRERAREAIAELEAVARHHGIGHLILQTCHRAELYWAGALPLDGVTVALAEGRLMHRVIAGARRVRRAAPLAGDHASVAEALVHHAFVRTTAARPQVLVLGGGEAARGAVVAVRRAVRKALYPASSYLRRAS